MRILEKILVKMLGNTKGFSFNMWDWDIMTLAGKYTGGIPLSPSEVYASTFLRMMGEYMEIWSPSEKWKKPYGDELNEHRNLH